MVQTYTWTVSDLLFIYRGFHAKSPPPLTFFPAKKEGGEGWDLQRHFDPQPISAKKRRGGFRARYIFLGDNRLKYGGFLNGARSKFGTHKIFG